MEATSPTKANSLSYAENSPQDSHLNNNGCENLKILYNNLYGQFMLTV